MIKEIIKIEIGKSITVNVLVKDKALTDEIIKEIEKGVNNAFVFFNDLKKVNFEIELIYSREEFDEYLKEKTESWVIAHSFKEKFTSHKRSEFLQIVCHETCHILLQKINQKFSFWIFEGIALNVANQTKRGEIKKENSEYFINECLFKNPSYGEFISHQGYLISYFLMKYFLDNYDKKVVMDLIKISYETNNPTQKKFCKIINMKNEEVAYMVKKFLENKKA